MSIIKRKKQDKFFIMSNHATQKDLTSLSSIGLLAYIKSLPEDFVLYKTYLQRKFTRRTVDNAWSELVIKGYIAGFTCYINRKKRYFYLVNDQPLTIDDFNEFVEETIKEVKEEEGFQPKTLNPIKDCKFTIAQNVQHSTSVQNVQYRENSTPGTEPEIPVQIHRDKDIPQINSNISVNTNVHIDTIQSLFLELGEGLFSKDDIMYFADKILEEVKEEITHPRLYFTTVVEMIVMRRKKKLGLYKPPVEIYNWLEA